MQETAGPDFDRRKVLLKNLTKATTNCENRLHALAGAEARRDETLSEMIRESVIQTYEVAIELAWKTAKAFALAIEPSGRVSGSTTAIKLAFSTGVIHSESLSRVLIEAIQNRNMSSHEYMVENGLEEYVDSIRSRFKPALCGLIEDLKEQA